MKTRPKHKALTLGEFIMTVYDACAAPKAGVVVWLALKTQRVVFQKHGGHVR